MRKRPDVTFADSREGRPEMSRATRTSITRVVLVVSLAAALVFSVAGGTANAGLPPRLCTAAGTILTTTGTPDTWTIVGQGSCNDLSSTYAVSFTGAGTSQGLGLCSPEPVPFVVTNLNITITGTLVDSLTQVPIPFAEKWVAPLTTYPLGTPFVVTTLSGGLKGAGNFFNHIFLQCNGSPVATFQWVEIA